MYHFERYKKERKEEKKCKLTTLTKFNDIRCYGIRKKIISTFILATLTWFSTFRLYHFFVVMKE